MIWEAFSDNLAIDGRVPTAIFILSKLETATDKIAKSASEFRIILYELLPLFFLMIILLRMSLLILKFEINLLKATIPFFSNSSSQSKTSKAVLISVNPKRLKIAPPIVALFLN